MTETVKWCEQCEQWFHATPRRCPKCSSKWVEMVTPGAQEWQVGTPWPQVPPRYCDDFYTSDLHRVAGCRACQALSEGAAKGRIR